MSPGSLPACVCACPLSLCVCVACSAPVSTAASPGKPVSGLQPHLYVQACLPLSSSSRHEEEGHVYKAAASSVLPCCHAGRNGSGSRQGGGVLHHRGRHPAMSVCFRGMQSERHSSWLLFLLLVGREVLQRRQYLLPCLPSALVACLPAPKCLHGIPPPGEQKAQASKAECCNSPV